MAHSLMFRDTCRCGEAASEWPVRVILFCLAFRPIYHRRRKVVIPGGRKSSAEGARFRSAEGAEGGKAWGGGPQKIFGFLISKL